MENDLLARWLGSIGIVIGMASIALTGVLWRRISPVLKVTAFVNVAEQRLHLSVMNRGLLTVELKQFQVRDDAMSASPQAYYTAPSSTWAAQAGLALPQTLSPGSHLEWNFDVGPLVAKNPGDGEIWIKGWAERGDDRWYSSRSVRLR